MAQQKLRLENIIIQSFITSGTVADAQQNDAIVEGNPTITEPLPTNACATVATHPNATKMGAGCNGIPPGVCKTGSYCDSPDFGWTGKYVCSESAGTYCQRVCPSAKNYLYPNCDGGFYDTYVNCTNPYTDRTVIYQCKPDIYSVHVAACTNHPLVCPTGPDHTKDPLKCGPPKTAVGAGCQTKSHPEDAVTRNNCATFNFNCPSFKGGGGCPEDNTKSLIGFCLESPIIVLDEDGINDTDLVTWDFDWKPIDF